MLEVNDFDAVRISLASPEQIRSWSYGEVTKPETINYRTLKPERDGLFCERIFGPTKDFECFCGKYKKIRYKGVICDKCGVEVARSKVRRERMGHIELASPVSHIWFARGIPSRMGLLLGLSPRNLERVLYFSHYIITSIDEKARQRAVEELRENTSQEKETGKSDLEVRVGEKEEAGATVEEINKLRSDWVDEEMQREEKTESNIEQVENLRERAILNENRYNELKQKFGDVFEAEMGAEAILKLLKGIDLEKTYNDLIQETRLTSGQRRKRASKQLQIVETFRRSGNKPEWMILTVLPVLPPDLRPMVQLNGDRFATSGLNDLYRRVINRNNRLRHLLEIGAPSIIIRNEKRMLQEAVDSLIDNDKAGGRAVSFGSNHKLKSLSDMLRGKQGRFRQNLLGKRVDYSGRSVIVVGPNLKLHQCGLSRRMALELFKPFIVHRLMDRGLAFSDKSARRLVARANPAVYDILEEVVKERPVLLNRAPTLHRLGIQAFEPVLIDGSAIQIHPLICSTFNADFDGDQMAVHLPLSRAAVKEARELMLSVHNMLLPSCGEPIVIPTLDMTLGCYYLTTIRKGAMGEGRVFGSMEEAQLAYDSGIIDLRAEVEVRKDGERIKTSVGRIIFNEVLPPELRDYNRVVDKTVTKHLVASCQKLMNNEDLAVVLDAMKNLGFHYATLSGTTIGMSDIKIPDDKGELIKAAEDKTVTAKEQYNQGIITEDESYNSVVGIWMNTTELITDSISRSLDRYGSIYMMSTSGAKGNISQIRQMAGMRGLMTNPSGKIIDFPIKSSLREGLSVLEYFISTHGARKGLADTALRTSESGYLTRRLVDVAQDTIIREEDCGTTGGIWISELKEDDLLPPLSKRVIGRISASRIVDPQSNETIVERNEEIDETKAKMAIDAGIKQIQVRSPLTCQSRQGICRLCYGWDLAHGNMVELNTAVGIIAAQSIGEPGTQLTLRTFHTGGVVGIDITTGLPRIEELFEARTPKGRAIITEIDGVVEIIDKEEEKRIKVSSSQVLYDEYTIPPGWVTLAEDKEHVHTGTTLAHPPETDDATTDGKSLTAENRAIVARFSGKVNIEGEKLFIEYEDMESREYPIPATAHIRVNDGDRVSAGDQLTDGSIDPQEFLTVKGKDAVQRYLVDEVQKVYRSQGVNINDKHIEVIARQMLTKVRIDKPGDTDLVTGELIDRFQYEDINRKIVADGGEPATAEIRLMGITRSSLNTDSWLAAASFQETTKILTEAAVGGKIDKLSGLKENVIIGKLIPAYHHETKETAELPAGNKDEGEDTSEITVQ
ncbi:MAG: DNA-directed RNA polymerase subunit beta' [Dehalococcoidales bacterium]